MCKSAAEGGQRCSAHTSAQFMKTTLGTPEWEDAAAAHASTRAGEHLLRRLALIAKNTGKFEREAQIKVALNRGAAIRAAHRETAARIANGTTPHPEHLDIAV